MPLRALVATAARVLRFDPELEDVRALYKRFGIIEYREPGHLSARKAAERLGFLREELGELEDALARRDLAEVADALVDLVYVAKGTALMLGLPWAEHWAEVQAANMRKVRGVGKRGHPVDLVKPAGWLPPDHDTILWRAGFRPASWPWNSGRDDGGGA